MMSENLVVSGATEVAFVLRELIICFCCGFHTRALLGCPIRIYCGVVDHLCSAHYQTLG